MFIPGCGTSGKVRGLCEANPDTVKPLWATVDFLDDSANAPSVEFG